MKKLKSIFAIFAIALMFLSCKKTTTESSCLTVCQNGGIVTPNCGCNCPSGFTGANCQTPIVTTHYYPATVNINPNSGHQLCPQWYSDDNDFGGYLTIEWKVQLFMTDNNTKIYAKVYADFKEYPTTGNTAAWIDPSLASNQILLYSAPSGKRIYQIDRNYTYYSTQYPSANYHGNISIPAAEADSYLNKIDFIGDTSGPDLPCDGTTERSRCIVYFKTFSVTLTDR